MVVSRTKFYCSSCKKNKDSKYFYNSSTSGDWCKECRIEYNNERRYGEKRALELRQRRNRHLINTYGITLEQYELLLEEQEGLCFICRNKGKQSLAVDHNHTTGDNRGLLCNNCNTGLGNLKEDINSLKRAIEYIEKYSK